MDYEFWFWIFIAFFLGRAICKKKYFIYLGNDEELFQNSFIGIKYK